MSKRKPIVVLDTPDEATRRCPSCDRGFLTERGICDRCGIAVASGSAYVRQWTARGGMKRQDQDKTSPWADYVRYKQDHTE